MQKILKNNCTKLELVGNNNFFFVGHKVPHTSVKSLLKYIHLGWEKIQNYLAYSENNG